MHDIISLWFVLGNVVFMIIFFFGFVFKLKEYNLFFELTLSSEMRFQKTNFSKHDLNMGVSTKMNLFKEVRKKNTRFWRRKKNLLVMRRFVEMVTVAIAFQSGSVDLDTEYGSILRERIEISLVVIRYVQYPTDHTHLKNQTSTNKSLIYVDQVEQ